MSVLHMKKTLIFTTAIVFNLSMSRGVRADEKADKGIGPISEVKLDPVDVKLAGEGKKFFETKCSACHKIPERYVGPALKDVTVRRTPEWIMNMILNPAEMIEKNDAAKELFGEFLIPMTFQNVSKEEARAILEYFRQQDSGMAPAEAKEKTNEKSKGKAKDKQRK